MIVAIEGLIPDRRAVSKDNKSDPPPSQPDIYPAAWLHQQRENIDPQPGSATVEEEDEANLAGARTRSRVGARRASAPRHNPQTYLQSQRVRPRQRL